MVYCTLSLTRFSSPLEDALPPANMDDLDEYLEMLYEGTGKSEAEKEEGLKAQIRGSLMILKLSRDVMNLEQLIQNATGVLRSVSLSCLPTYLPIAHSHTLAWPYLLSLAPSPLPSHGRANPRASRGFQEVG